MANGEPTPVSGWKKTQGVAVEMPSGNTALLRPATIDTFMRLGIIPNSLIKTFVSAAQNGKGHIDQDKLKGEFLSSLDQSKIDEIFSVYDAVCLYCVVNPRVHPIPVDSDGNPIPFQDRDQEKLYVDEVDLEDKAYIFQWVTGGTRDLESFRKQSTQTLGNLFSGQNMELPT